MLLLGLGCASFARTVHATKPQQLKQAQALFIEASEHEEAGRFSEALAGFEQVVAIVESPATRYHMARCKEKLGRLREALHDYELAQQGAQKRNNHEVLELVQAPIERLRKHLPRLVFTMPSEETTEAGERGERTPQGEKPRVELELDPGEYTLRLHNESGELSTRSLQLLVGERVALPVSSAPPSMPLSLPPPAEPRTVLVQRYPLRPWAIGTTVGALALAGVGVGFLWHAGATVSSHVDKCGVRGTLSTCGHVQRYVRKFDALALGALIGSGALTAVSLVLWTRPGVQEEKPRAQQRLRIAPGEIVFEGTF